MSRRYRNYLRGRITRWKDGKEAKPKINKLNADTISVFEEYNLEAKSFLSDSHKVDIHLQNYPKDTRSREQLLYLLRQGKRL